MCLVERITMLLRIQMSSSALHPLRLELSVPRFLAGNPSREDLSPETGYSFAKQSGLATAVKPAEPVMTTLFAPPLQWTIRRLPSVSRPPTMPTWASPG